MNTVLEMLRGAGLIFLALNLAVAGAMVSVKFLGWLWLKLNLGDPR